MKIKELLSYLKSNVPSKRKLGIEALISDKTISVDSKIEFLERFVPAEKDPTIKSVAKLYLNRFKEISIKTKTEKKQVNKNDKLFDIFKVNSITEKIKIIDKFIKSEINISKKDLLQQLDIERSSFVIAAIINALSKFKDEDVAIKICSYLKSNDARIRANSIDSLEAIGIKKYFTEIKPLLNDESSRVKANAIRVLMRNEKKENSPFLEEMISSKNENDIQSANYTNDRLKNIITKNQEEKVSIISKEAMICPNCSKIFPQGNSFCNECGSKLLLKNNTHKKEPFIKSNKNLDEVFSKFKNKISDYKTKIKSSLENNEPPKNEKIIEKKTSNIEVSEKSCTYCNKKNSKYNYFCDKCGQELIRNHIEHNKNPLYQSRQKITCVSCGTIFNEEIYFCENCGNELRLPYTH